MERFYFNPLYFIAYCSLEDDLCLPVYATPSEEAEFPEQNMLHRREQHITTICHTLLSLAEFDLGPEDKTLTNILKLITKPLSYSIATFVFSVQITCGDPNIIISMGWKHPDVQSQFEPVRA